MKDYFRSMAGAVATGFGPDVETPVLSSNAAAPGMEVYVDVAELIDVATEIKKKEKEVEKLEGFIKSKEAKLSGGFAEKAPAHVVEKERASLEELKTQRDVNVATLERLRAVAASRQ